MAVSPEASFHRLAEPLGNVRLDPIIYTLRPARLMETWRSSCPSPRLSVIHHPSRAASPAGPPSCVPPGAITHGVTNDGLSLPGISERPGHFDTGALWQPRAPRAYRWTRSAPGRPAPPNLPTPLSLSPPTPPPCPPRGV